MGFKTYQICVRTWSDLPEPVVYSSEDLLGSATRHCYSDHYPLYCPMHLIASMEGGSRKMLEYYECLCHGGAAFFTFVTKV